MTVTYAFMRQKNATSVASALLRHHRRFGPILRAITSLRNEWLTEWPNYSPCLKRTTVVWLRESPVQDARSVEARSTSDMGHRDLNMKSTSAAAP